MLIQVILFGLALTPLLVIAIALFRLHRWEYSLWIAKITDQHDSYGPDHRRNP